MRSFFLLIAGPLGWAFLLSDRRKPARPEPPNAKSAWGSVKARRFQPWTDYPHEER